jgi:23S rRNA U2552 (ribose-2'-O)-methylase RlmE/FtsJ
MNNHIISVGHIKNFVLIDKQPDLSYGKKSGLMKIKCEIDKIPSKKWERSKKKCNKYEYIYTSSRKNRNICNITPVSRSYFKIYEIINTITKLENEGIAGCIAEGPGGFIHCINDNTNMDVYGITLISKIDKNIPFWNPQIIANSKNTLSYGKDNSGDIYNIENSLDFINSFEGKLCNLVTADGGFDYSGDYNSQESDSYRLLFSEIFIALNIQKQSGSFIIKFFDLFNYKTIQLIYILYISYKEINIFKPITSRLSNSEKYIVCNGFNGCNLEIIKQMEKNYKTGDISIDIPETFIKEIFEYNDKFVESQKETIRKIITNIDLDCDNNPTKEQIKNAKDWCLKYNLPINQNCIYMA